MNDDDDGDWTDFLMGGQGEPTRVSMDIATKSVAEDIALNLPVVASTSTIGKWSSRGQDQEQGANVAVVNPILTSESFSSSSFSFPQPMVASTSITGQGSSKGLGGNVGVANPILPSEIFSSSSFSFPQPVIASTSITGQGSSKGLTQEHGGNMGVVNPILTSENYSNSSLSIPQLIWPAGEKEWQHPSGGNSTITGSRTPDPLPHDPPQVGASLGNSMFPNSTEHSLNQFQSGSSPSFPVLPYGSSGDGGGVGKCSRQQFQRHRPLGTPTMGDLAQQYSYKNLFPPPRLMDLQDYMKAFEECLVGRVHSYRSSLDQEKQLTSVHIPQTMKQDTGGQNDYITEARAKSPAKDITSNSSMVVSTSTTREWPSRAENQELGGNMGRVNPILNSENFSSSSFSFHQPVVASTSITGEGSSRGLAQELGGNVGVVNPILTSENYSNSSFSLPQLMSPDLWPVGRKEWQHPSGGNNTTAGLGTPDTLPYDPPQVGASPENSMSGNSIENSLNQFQLTSSASFSVYPYGGGDSGDGNGSVKGSHQQCQRHRPFEMTGLSSLGTPAMRYLAQQYNQRNLPPPPPLMDIKDYVKAWEGCLIGRVHSYRACLNQARVMAKPTSASSLTSAWSSRLEIAIFIPIKAVNYTLRIIGGPIDYVFFHITQFNNLDLYDHLRSKNLCAKIELPSHTIILSTTESKHHFLGIIFSRDTIFIEPV